MIKKLLLLLLIPSLAFGQVLPTRQFSPVRFQSCTASNVTGTTDVAIKAAVTGAAMYVTEASCLNTATVASGLTLRSNTTNLWYGGISNTTLSGVGVWSQEFLTPLKVAKGEALNILMSTNATNTLCCAVGYLLDE
jgi:hypothetical protein